jgi:hypothetical protein
MHLEDSKKVSKIRLAISSLLLESKFPVGSSQNNTSASQGKSTSYSNSLLLSPQKAVEGNALSDFAYLLFQGMFQQYL